ncbi:MAG: GNAT family N-acetyltransferase [Massilia sp.]
MTTAALEIRSIDQDDLPRLFLYLDDHLLDNGRDGTPLFQPQSRADARFTVDKAASFTAGLGVAIGEPGWRRAWLACDEAGAIAGHVDLRARPEPAARHRALLGMGVHRDYRRQGLGLRLIEEAVAWAAAHTGLDWIDLEVLSVNEAAHALYRRAGFVTVGEFADMFRIDGESLAYTLMTRPLRTDCQQLPITQCPKS